MLAEIECEIEEASALFETRSGRFPAPARPCLPAPEAEQSLTAKVGRA